MRHRIFSWDDNRFTYGRSLLRVYVSPIFEKGQIRVYKATSYKATSYGYKTTSYKERSYKTTSHKLQSHKATSYKTTSYEVTSYEARSYEELQIWLVKNVKRCDWWKSWGVLIDRKFNKTTLKTRCGQSYKATSYKVTNYEATSYGATSLKFNYIFSTMLKIFHNSGCSFEILAILKPQTTYSYTHRKKKSSSHPPHFLHRQTFQDRNSTRQNKSVGSEQINLRSYRIAGLMTYVEQRD